MAKISTYPFPASPSLSDYVIGTDSNDSLATKNFMISDIIALGGTTYVPYIGANQDVNLGTFGIYAYSLYMNGGSFYDGNGSPGSSGQILSSQGPALSPVWVDLSTLATDYVPYIGATTDVDLGNYSIYTGGITFNNNGTIVDGNDVQGTLGQVLSSQGPGLSPLWVDVESVIPTNVYGSFYDVTTQTNALGQVKAIELGVTDTSATNGFSITNNALGRPTRITCTQAGVYNLAFSAQLVKGGGGSPAQIDIWFRVNGIDIPNSNTGITMRSNGDKIVAAWNFFVSLTAGQYVEIMWTQADAIDLVADAMGVNYPATPSVIATINKVS